MQRSLILLASFALAATARAQEDGSAADEAVVPSETAETRPAAESEAEEDRRRRRSPTTTKRATTLFLRSPSGHQSLEFGMFLSATLSVYPVDAPAGGLVGFNIDNARLAFWGDLYEDFEYVLQVELARVDQPLLDMAIAWEPLDELRLTAGLFKVPFAYEFILSAANIPLQRRAQVVETLAPNRQAGVQLSGRIAGGLLSYALGVFNGTTFDEPDALSNVDDDFLYAGRVASEIEPNDETRLEIGMNVAGGREADLRYAFVSADPFDGGRLLLGLDATLHWRGVLLATEWIAGRIAPDAGVMLATTQPGWVWGFHLTAGYSFFEYLAAYVRWDRFDTRAFDVALANDEPRDLLVLSVASGTRGAAPVGAQLDVIVPMREPENVQILVNVLAVF